MVPRQLVERHFVYDTSSTDNSSTDISYTSVSVFITANQQRPLSYSFTKTCYIFSEIQLLITEKLFSSIPLLLNGNLVSSVHRAWFPASIYRKNYFDQPSFYFNISFLKTYS